jgi:hypothetical protein
MCVCACGFIVGVRRCVWKSRNGLFVRSF